MAATFDCSDDPKCDKCGAPITTGMMAMICPAGKDCEFWVPEVEDFKAMFKPKDVCND